MLKLIDSWHLVETRFSAAFSGVALVWGNSGSLQLCRHREMRLALLPVALLASLVSYAIAQPQPPLHVVDRIPVDRAHRHTHGCTHGEAAKMPPNHPSEIRKRAIKEAREAALKAAQAAEKQQNRWVLGREDYLESLRINPLPDGKVHSDFDFTFDGPWYDEAHHVASNTIGADCHSRYSICGGY